MIFIKCVALHLFASLLAILAIMMIESSDYCHYFKFAWGMNWSRKKVILNTIIKGCLVRKIFKYYGFSIMVRNKIIIILIFMGIYVNVFLVDKTVVWLGLGMLHCLVNWGIFLLQMIFFTKIVLFKGKLFFTP